jgi:hypothetical protein
MHPQGALDRDRLGGATDNFELGDLRYRLTHGYRAERRVVRFTEQPFQTHSASSTRSTAGRPSV